LIFDKKGNLYGTTSKGGIYGKAGGGVMFEITHRRRRLNQTAGHSLICLVRGNGRRQVSASFV
jgi:hypothetical protein